MKNIKNDWWKTDFDNNFYKIYYHYLKQNYSVYIDRLIKFTNLKKEKAVLDLACGSGEHLIALHKKGFNNVEGSDYNYAETAQKNTKKYKILIQKKDMREKLGKNVYDLITLNSTSFGYFNDNDNKKVLKNCYEALKSKGSLFINNLSREFIVDNFHPKSWTKLGPNVFLLEERWWSKNKKSLLSSWHLVEKNRVHTLSNKLRLYSAQEFKNLFYEIGFKKIKIKKINAHNWFLAIKK
ncbi:MAG: class I SAM-dependent methyltransferase [Patescibacteria group bacterium]|nr:class I SAM-dependent methyltransferase [Patescibacteria group bacterium]